MILHVAETQGLMSLQLAAKYDIMDIKVSIKISAIFPFLAFFSSLQANNAEECISLYFLHRH